MAYKQKSSGLPFKQMGSTPAKQSLDFWNQTPEEHKIRQAKDVAEHKTSKAKNFNTKGGKTTTPGYSTTKGAKTTTPKKAISLVERTTDLLHKNEKKIGELKESRAKDIKRVKGNTVKVSKKEILKQMQKSGTKLPYSSIKKALSTSIKAAGKVAKFVPGVAGLILGSTTTATADQPTLNQGKKMNEGAEIKELLTKHKLKGGNNK
jgi:hypothetical protein